MIIDGGRVRLVVFVQMMGVAECNATVVYGRGSCIFVHECIFITLCYR